MTATYYLKYTWRGDKKVEQKQLFKLLPVEVGLFKATRSKKSSFPKLNFIKVM